MAQVADTTDVSISLFYIKYTVKSLFVSDLGIFEQGMVLSRQGYFPRNGHEPTIAKASKSEEYRPSVSSGRVSPCI